MNNNYNSKYNIYLRNLEYDVRNVYKQEKSSSSDSELDSDFDERLDKSFNRIIKEMKTKEKVIGHNSNLLLNTSFLSGNSTLGNSFILNNNNKLVPNEVKEKNLSSFVDQIFPSQQASVEKCATRNESVNCVDNQIQEMEIILTQTVVVDESLSLVQSAFNNSSTLNASIEIAVKSDNIPCASDTTFSSADLPGVNKKYISIDYSDEEMDLDVNSTSVVDTTEDHLSSSLQSDTDMSATFNESSAVDLDDSNWTDVDSDAELDKY